jgi:hypothetical protein
VNHSAAELARSTASPPARATVTFTQETEPRVVALTWWLFLTGDKRGNRPLLRAGLEYVTPVRVVGELLAEPPV